MAVRRGHIRYLKVSIYNTFYIHFFSDVVSYLLYKFNVKPSVAY